jgi:hypothetical protein
MSDIERPEVCRAFASIPLLVAIELRSSDTMRRLLRRLSVVCELIP